MNHKTNFLVSFEHLSDPNNVTLIYRQGIRETRSFALANRFNKIEIFTAIKSLLNVLVISFNEGQLRRWKERIDGQLTGQMRPLRG